MDMTAMTLTETLIDWLTGRDADESEVTAALATCDRTSLQWAIDEIGPLVPA
jgi:hypothetical protein